MLRSSQAQGMVLPDAGLTFEIVSRIMRPMRPQARLAAHASSGARIKRLPPFQAQCRFAPSNAMFPSKPCCGWMDACGALGMALEISADVLLPRGSALRKQCEDGAQSGEIKTKPIGNRVISIVPALSAKIRPQLHPTPLMPLRFAVKRGKTRMLSPTTPRRPANATNRPRWRQGRNLRNHGQDSLPGSGRPFPSTRVLRGAPAVLVANADAMRPSASYP